jgi:hypothetical protein
MVDLMPSSNGGFINEISDDSQFLFVLVRVISWIVCSSPIQTIHEFKLTNTKKLV